MSELKHVVSSREIYFTTEYGRFKFLKGNRELNERKIDKLVEDIKAGIDFLPYCPIIVNEQMEIIDGQHRFMAARKLKTNVHYMIKKDATLEVVPAINSKGSKWRTVDFMNSYVDLGKKEYLKLRDFMEEFPRISLPVAIKVLHDGNTKGSEAVDLFREGAFVVSFEERAREVAQKLQDFEPYTDNPFSARFVNVMLRLIESELYDHEAMKEKLAQAGKRIENIDSEKSIISNLEEIANHRLKTRIFII
jgi:glutaredoxin-related protein